jgi:hypothetical protein
MEDTILTIYCLCDEYLSAFGFEDDPQATLSTAEVMTVALVAATFYGGHLERSRLFLKHHGYLPRMLSKSRLNRRLHAIPSAVWQGLFAVLAETFKASNSGQEYIIDSLPVPVCDNIRIRRCRLYPITDEDDFRGYIASKRRYFYGLRVHLLVTATGKPVEFALAPGAWSDLPVFREFALELPRRSVIYADKLYNDYSFEDFLKEVGIRLMPLRKKNSKRPLEPWKRFLQQHTRKQVETTFSRITEEFPKSIHAVTARGFELKIACFLLAFAIGCL